MQEKRRMASCLRQKRVIAPVDNGCFRHDKPRLVRTSVSPAMNESKDRLAECLPVT